MQTADVIVIGGGPAGSTCAWRLRRAGAKVIVVDAARFPRDKVCAGWITPRVIAALELDTTMYAKAWTFQPLHGFRVGRVGQDAAVSVCYDAMVSAAIRRCEFDAYLLDRSGATLITGTPVTSLRRDGRCWVVNDCWTAPVVVGAGGYGCPAARQLNGPIARDAPLVVARETEFALDLPSKRDCLVQGAVAEIYFTADLQGYGWCVRKRDVMNVGIGRLDRRLPLGDVAAFAAFIRERRGVATPGVERWHGHAYVAGAPRTLRRSAGGVLIVGDAAGLASDRSGEGIGPAVDSALMAARVIAEASGDFSEERLARYDALIAGTLASVASIDLGGSPHAAGRESSGCGVAARASVLRSRGRPEPLVPAGESARSRGSLRPVMSFLFRLVVNAAALWVATQVVPGVTTTTVGRCRSWWSR